MQIRFVCDLRNNTEGAGELDEQNCRDKKDDKGNGYHDEN